MNESLRRIIDLLEARHSLSEEQYVALLTGRDAEAAALLAEKARRARQAVYGKAVYIRGLIEAGNFCRNDCLYCGIRRSNRACQRYRLTREQIMACCREGYELGFRTFVLQGGEGLYSVAELCGIVAEIRALYPDCAVTLSLGEMERGDYQRLFDAGANRYLLRHETADRAHYESLHPPEMSFEHRMRCLRDLKEIGYQTGCGFMVGSPGQTARTLAQDLLFIERFAPEMCGIGPFIPQKDTPLGRCLPGSAELTLYLLSIVRLIRPNILLPATTALSTLLTDGRERGILAGANVVMPNLSPLSAREKYVLYDRKLFRGAESAEQLSDLKRRMRDIGYEVVSDRGDIRENLERSI